MYANGYEKLTNVEITQARNLDVEFLAVRQRGTNFTRRMALRLAAVGAGEKQSCRDLRSRYCGTQLPSTFFQPSLSLRRMRTTPAHRVRLPAGGLHHRFDRCRGDCGEAMTHIFEPRSAVLGSGSPHCVAMISSLERRLALTPSVASSSFDIEILVRFRGVAPPEAPPRRWSRRGRISGRPWHPEINGQYRSNGAHMPVLSGQCCRSRSATFDRRMPPWTTREEPRFDSDCVLGTQFEWRSCLPVSNGDFPEPGD